MIGTLLVVCWFEFEFLCSHSHNCNTISQFAAPPATNATPPPAQPQPQMFGHQFQQPQQQQQFVQHQAPTLTVNRQPVNAQQQQLLMQLGCTSGDLWYDHTSGGWGIMGGPCRGAIRANLPLPGPMPVDASNGNTKVFLNGRELHMMDCWAISMMTGEPCLPGLLSNSTVVVRSTSLFFFVRSLVVQRIWYAGNGRLSDSNWKSVAR
jgi:hypothetical protein